MTNEDLAGVVEIQRQILRREPGEAWRRMLANHVGGAERSAFVAEDDGLVLGFILVEVKAGGFGAELTGWIEVIGVRPDHMGGGVGSALVGQALEHFAAAGVADVCTAVRWDSGDLLAFFKNLGFDRSPFINLQKNSG